MASLNSDRSAPFEPAILILIALALQVGWLAYTNYTAEDAFITFKYAQRIAAGQGFVHNIGEKVYGTTTPLFTLLMAGWLKILSGDIVLGARVYDLTAALASLLLLWSTLSALGVPRAHRVLAVSVCVFSAKIWFHDTAGMEMPLTTALMMLSWFAVAQKRHGLAGFAAGVLLWTRIDTVIWLFALVIATWVSERKAPLRFLAGAALTYLPWLLFATFYFGSPIPHTITAKYAHYVARDGSTLGWHAAKVLQWLTPFTSPDNWPSAAIWLPFITGALAAAGTLYARRVAALRILPLFAILEFSRLVISRATFEPRYMFPLLWAVLILAGFGIASFYQRIQHLLTALMPHTNAALWFSRASLLFPIMFCLYGGYLRLDFNRDVQSYRHEQSLMQIGLWLNAHTPPNATVLLEPLGYAGFYADRRMIDEIGLISPQMAKLQQDGADAFAAIPIIQPDYVVVLCDGAEDWLNRQDATGHNYFRDHYTQVAMFDPLKLGSGSASDLARQSCYEIWIETTPTG